MNEFNYKVLDLTPTIPKQFIIDMEINFSNHTYHFKINAEMEINFNLEPKVDVLVKILNFEDISEEQLISLISSFKKVSNEKFKKFELYLEEYISNLFKIEEFCSYFNIPAYFYSYNDFVFDWKNIF